MRHINIPWVNWRAGRKAICTLLWLTGFHDNGRGHIRTIPMQMCARVSSGQMCGYQGFGVFRARVQRCNVSSVGRWRGMCGGGKGGGGWYARYTCLGRLAICREPCIRKRAKDCQQQGLVFDPLNPLYRAETGNLVIKEQRTQVLLNPSNSKKMGTRPLVLVR